MSPQFWTSDEHETTRGWSPVLIDQTHPALKKKENFKEVLIHNHSQQIFSADFFSRSSQQIFSAEFLSRSFSADLLSRSSQQIFSADLLICCGQGLVVSYCLIILIICCGQGLVVSYCLIICCGQFSRSSQQIFSAEFLSRSFSADLLSRSSQQIFSFAVVRGWWSAIVLSFLSFAVVRGWWSAIVLSFAVVRGWWSAIVLSCWWSILHEFFRRTLSRSFREKMIILFSFWGRGIQHLLLLNCRTMRKAARILP